MTEYINAFPGYEYKLLSDGRYHNMFRGVDVGRGGWVFGKKGIHTNVALLDAASMHPTSIIALNKLGKYTQNYADLRQARVYIKHGDYESAGKLFDGKLKKYLGDKDTAKALSAALKLPINAFYGIGYAGFSNPARDSRDKNNIVALRGALFMKTLFDEVEARGYSVVAVRTDSIKIANADLEIVKFVQEFGKKYSYEMEHEATYDRMCLVDDAQYVAALMKPEECVERYGYVPSDNEARFRENRHAWTTTGKKFQRPFIFKTLFSGEQPTFDDYCVTNTVKDAAIYLDLNENCPDVSVYEKERDRRIYNKTNSDDKMKLNPELSEYTDDALAREIEKGHNYKFVGRVGRFYPIKPGAGGGLQMVYRNNKYDSVSGSKGYRWLEAEVVQKLHKEGDIDIRYADDQIDEVIRSIDKLGSFERFIDLSKPYEVDIPAESNSDDDDPPWYDLPPVVPCGDGKFNTCLECPNCKDDVCKRGYSLSSYVENGRNEM